MLQISSDIENMRPGKGERIFSVRYLLTSEPEGAELRSLHYIHICSKKSVFCRYYPPVPRPRARRRPQLDCRARQPTTAGETMDTSDAPVKAVAGQWHPSNPAAAGGASHDLSNHAST